MKKINFKELVKPYKDESLENLRRWIQIDSVNDPSTVTPSHPFGSGVENALKFIADLAIKEGFNVDRCDNYCTEISFGEGRLIGIYAHADVVPVTGNWTHEPFGAEIADDKMFGRGTSDDKGPAMAAFYALKALKDNGLIKGYKVCMVVGGNEELGSRCLHHYFHELKKPYPDYGFTPDADFPLIYGEKGIGGYLHNYEINNPNILSLEGGIAANMVIDKASATLIKDDRLMSSLKEFEINKDFKYEVEDCGNQIKLVVTGKSAHGSVPQMGINAGLWLIKFLGYHYQDAKLEQLADIYLEPTGKKMDCYKETKYLHNTTFNVGVMKFEDGVLKLVVNYRYPEGVDLEETRIKINNLACGHVDSIRGGEPLLFDPESTLVKTLLKAYQEETGDYKTPIMTIGGGTYAKESKNTIAFGSCFPGRYDKIHEPDEEIHLEDFFNSQYIYARGIYDLGTVEDEIKE